MNISAICSCWVGLLQEQNQVIKLKRLSCCAPTSTTLDSSLPPSIKTQIGPFCWNYLQPVALSELLMLVVIPHISGKFISLKHANMNPDSGYHPVPSQLLFILLKSRKHDDDYIKLGSIFLKLSALSLDQQETE